MKLQCQVEVVNRLLSNLNIRSSGKYLKSTLALGKEPKDENAYFILLFSSNNKSGTKYRVKCIKQVFVKCINEGKATIRFEEPPHDLCIRSEAIQLKCFMRLLRSCTTGDTKNLQIAPLSSLSVTPKDIAPTRLVIRDRSEYPVKGLPRTLETLYINGLNLYNFRRDILLLKQLVVLDLTNNALEKIPPEFEPLPFDYESIVLADLGSESLPGSSRLIQLHSEILDKSGNKIPLHMKRNTNNIFYNLSTGRMPNLRELHVANNKLGVNGEIDWGWVEGPQIIQKLKLLDIGGNKLGYLPKSIWKLQQLVTLKLDKNMLKTLPTTIGRMSSLRFLTITQNDITSLPCSLIHCRLEYIDLSENKFETQEYTPDTGNYTPWKFYIGNLVALASKVILKRKMHYASNIIPWTLVEFLDNANMCICGAPVVNSSFYLCKGYELKDYFNIVVFDSDTRSTVPFQCYFCSPECFNR